MKNENEKSLFDDLIAVDEPVAITPDEQDDNPEPKEVELDEERGNNPPAESPPAEEPDAEEVDDRAVALFNFLKDEALTDVAEFSGKPSDLVDILDSLPETLFFRAVEGVHPDAQDLLSYAFQLGPNASAESLKKFFDKFSQTDSVEISSDEDAEVFMRKELSANKLFKTEEKINKYIDDLIEKGELLNTAKELSAERETNKAAARAAEVAKAEEARKQAKVEAEKFYKTLYDTVQEQTWTDDRKNIVLSNLIPEKVSQVNSQIMNSPKAMIQLADIYSRFNPKTGEFDFTDLALKADSKKVQEKKEALAKDKAGSILSGITRSGHAPKQGQSFWQHFEKVGEQS